MSNIAMKKNAILSLIVGSIPSVLGIITIPLLIKNLGLERFSYLSLIWAMTGYFGIFDLGLSRSLGKRASIRHADKNYHALGADMGFGILVISLLGIFVGILINFFGEKVIVSYFHLDNLFIEEAKNSVPIVALSVSGIMLLGALKGVLEGVHKFRLANKIQLVNGLSNFIIPTIISFYSPKISNLLSGLFVFRLGLLVVCYLWVNRIVSVRWTCYWDRSLLVDGGWLTLVSLASPLMLYVDRLVLGTLLPMKNLVFYSTPIDLVSKVWIIPQAVTRITFPTFSFSANDKHRTETIFSESTELISLLCIFPVLILFFFSHEILTIWLGSEIAMQSALILRILCVGVFWNCLGWVSYSLLQATNGSLFAGLLAIAEVPVYFIALWFFTSNHGLLGAAYVWSGRLILDAILVDSYILFIKNSLTLTIKRKFNISIAFLIASLIIFWSESFGPFFRMIIGFLVFGFTFIFYLRHPMVKEFMARYLKQ